MNTTCCICLLEINSTTEYKPYECHHLFHKSCIDLMNSYHMYKCPLCKSQSKNKDLIDLDELNYEFNNLTPDTINIIPYIKKWKHPDCFYNKHRLILETLGDWNFNEYEEFTLTFNKMWIKCQHCNIDEIFNK